MSRVRVEPVEEAQSLNLPEWRRPVVCMPLTQAFPQFEQIKEFRSKVCLFNEARDRVFDVVSDRYQLVEHGRAIDMVQNAMARYFGKAGAPQFIVRSFNGGARIRGEVRLPIPEIKLGERDVSHLTLMLRNSYDRSCTFSAKLGAFRVVCSNGAVIGDVFGSITARHVGARAVTDGDDSILDQFGEIVKRAPLVKRVWENWSDEKIDLDAATRLVAPMKLPQKYAEPIFDPQTWEKPVSKWEFYNRMTHMSTHLASSMQRRMEFDEQIAQIFYADIEVVE